MTQVSVHEAKTNLSRLIAEVLAGGEVVIARGHVPAVKLVPVEKVGKRQFGALKGKIADSHSFGDPLPDDELSAWEGR
jgi:prevent-host-death family protein